MTLTGEIQQEVAHILATSWKLRAGEIVPNTDNIKLDNDAVELDATVLYADLAESTELVDKYKASFAAEVYKSFLLTACRVIRANSGEITAFDGDRVMAVYIGESKNSNAARTALKIAWSASNIINPAIKNQYKNVSYSLGYGIGIDTSKLFIARTGIRGSNDLVWVGRAANYAAKLAALKDTGFSVLITDRVHDQLNEQAKFGGQPRKPMWEKRHWQARNITVYRSNWTWQPD